MFLYSSFTPSDSSLVSFEAVDRPNYFLYTSPGDNLRLAKWEESDAFWDGATFVLHRDTSVPGYDSLESFSKRGFFLHVSPSRLQLLKHRNWPAFRRGALFKLTGKVFIVETGIDRKINTHKNDLSAYGYIKPW